MANARFQIDLLKEQLTFSAAHFITFGDNICERLHGHNYALRCQIAGELNEHGYVVDFIAAANDLAKIAKTLDHHVLLPTLHPHISVQVHRNEVLAQFEERRWIFPLDDCCLLPVKNTTAELLAQYIAQQLIACNPQWSTTGIRSVLVGVDENRGQWGECELDLLADRP
jgi:6-pyruvoyltetrahydropterin/6-carboxytetrahydropterin synthase